MEKVAKRGEVDIRGWICDFGEEEAEKEREAEHALEYLF
jgi:hypothetical protein